MKANVSDELAMKIEMHGATPRLYDILVMENRHDLARELGRAHPEALPREILTRFADRLAEKGLPRRRREAS
jgi:hypothetical protein